MSGQPIAPPPGWYPAKGDPPGTQRFWNGSTWEGGPRPVPGVAVGDAFPLANLGPRLTARLIDLMIWLVIALIINRFFVLVLGGAGPLSWFLAGLAIIGYESWLVGSNGATVGKRVVGLGVVDEEGSRVELAGGLRRSAILGALTLLSLVPWLGILSVVAAPLLVLAGILMIYADDRQQTPWDKVGKTLVVMR